MQKILRRVSIFLVLLAAMTGSAYAHPGHATGGVLDGLAHPLSGLDHWLAMLAVGLWAAQLGGHARWLVPGSFLAVMAVGGVLGRSGMAMPLVESGVAASVLILGIFIATAVRLPVMVSMGLAGVFALFHGHAHGSEMPVAVSALQYGSGFIFTSALLHLAGILSVTAARSAQGKNSRPALPLLRMAGVAIAVAGLLIWAF